MTMHPATPELVRTAPPDRLVDGDGDGFRFGTFDAPVADVDLLARWSGPKRMLHRSRLKEWQAFQIGNDDHFVLGAIYDAKLLGLLQIVVVDKASGALRRWEHKVPSPVLHVACGLDGTRSSGSWRGLAITITNDVNAGHLGVTAHDRSGMHLDVAGFCGPGDAGHLVICHPFADGTPLYSNKCVMGASGTVSRPGEDEIAFAPERSFLILDDHKGHYPSPMQYDWVTGAVVEPDGRRVAFNLTDNQVLDPHRFNENAVFIDDAVFRLPAVTFERPGGVARPWRVRDREGRVDVTFDASVPNEQHVGPRSFLADYYGPFGWFSGTIEADGAPPLTVDGYYGMGEQKFIRF